jgi:hypothetical protein
LLGDLAVLEHDDAPDVFPAVLARETACAGRV